MCIRDSFYSNGGFGDNGKLIIDYDASSSGTPVLNSDITLDSVSGLQSNSASGYHVFWESASNSGIFTNVDDADDASLDTSASALRGTTATIDYNDSAQSLVVTNFGGSIDMAGEEAGEEWNSGEPITVTLVDEDRNKNPNSDEDLTVSASTNVPTITMGDAISPVENTHYANVTIQDCDGISGICLIAEHLDTAITTYTNSPIWQVELGVTVGSVGDGLTGSSATLNLSLIHI